MYFDNRPAFLDREDGASMISAAGLLGPRAQQYEQYRPLLQGKTVLDVGCCDGRWTAWALDSGATSVHGIDIEPRFIDSGAPIMADYFPEGGYSFEAVSWQDASPNMRFDVVLLFGIFYWQQPYELLNKAIGWGNTIILDTWVNELTDAGDAELTLEGIITPLEGAGFTVTAVSYPNNPKRYTILAVRA